MKTHSPLLKGFTLLALLLWALPDAAAQQLPRARLTSVFPAGGQQGTTLDVTVAGGDLDGANQLVFSHAGIKAIPKKDGLSIVCLIDTAGAYPGVAAEERHIAKAILVKISKVPAFRPEMRREMMFGPSVDFVVRSG